MVLKIILQRDEGKEMEEEERGEGDSEDKEDEREITRGGVEDDRDLEESLLWRSQGGSWKNSEKNERTRRRKRKREIEE